MSGSGTLNTANYKTVWQDNFTTDTSLNTSLFPVKWGDASEFSFNNGLTITSNGTAAGFLTPDSGASDSYGYGLYEATISMPTGQNPGAYMLMWPATNNWPGPEIDLVEQNNSHQPYTTVHWKGSGGTNQSQSFVFNANLAQPTTVAMDWEAGSLTFYVNGQEVVHYLAGGSVPIPADYAEGGQNEAFGPGNVGPAGTSITVDKMSYSQYVGSSSPTPSTTISVSNPGTVQEASPGAGVTVPITISDPGLTEVYAFVLNSANQAEENWIPITLNSLGQATYDFHFEHTGDYVLAVNNTATQTDRGTSAPITITDPRVTPSTTISVSNPGTQHVAHPSAGVTVPITISDPGLTDVYAFVLNSSNQAEENWIPIALNAQGSATYDFHFEHTGDYVLAVNNTTTQTDRGTSAPITILHS